ncbi:MAG: cell surface protein SprA, partial [Bacteroidota bacterium]
EVLGVAYQYTIIGDTGVYQVGEFSNGGIAAPECLIVKLLKSTAPSPKVIPMWNLCMRNVYSIGAYQVNRDDFRLNILYANDETGVPQGYISEGDISGYPLIQVFNLDRLNTQLAPVSDGVFDFVDGAATTGGTVNSANGRIFFPVLEPFGSFIKSRFSDPNLGIKYAFEELYDSTKTTAQQYPEKNKFYMAGVYKSSVSSDISLNAMNIPQGSVTVTAGGIKLTENVDFTVDYTLGRLKIINEGILNSGAPIKISLESNSLFNIQTKTLFGTHVDHKLSNDVRIGATLLNLTEKPLTQKVNIGDDPISNTIWGLDGTYQKESRLITKIIDKIPFINTKEVSKVTVSGEFAQLIPGHSKAIGKTGTSYIDDFEGSKSAIDLKSIGVWKLASTPQGQTESGMFPEGAPATLRKYGFNRALLSWYVVDPLFTYNYTSNTPDYIKDDLNMQSNHLVRPVLETEVFPNVSPPGGTPMNIAVLNLAYYPKDRGQYNYDVDAVPGYSNGVDQTTGKLNVPSSRWAGIMRKIETTDFEATNVEYVEFWMMDPFVYSDGQGTNPLHSGGDLYLNLGDISEDILRDGRKSFENGLPTSDTASNYDLTIWGRVPKIQALTNSFDNNPSSREFQDVGLDGLRTVDETSFYDSTYLSKFIPGSQAYNMALADPSTDNYHYFLGGDYDQAQTDILSRYKKFNGVDGNSPTDEQSVEDYPTSATTLPDVEDINRDNTLSESERYFQYKIHLAPNSMVVGENFITDVIEANPKLPNGQTTTVKWYQIKVPVRRPDRVVGSISDFKSIRFMRMFMKGFSDSIVLRFATLELVKTEWRKYNYSMLVPGEYVPNDESNETTFDVSAVNIEENGLRTPINYVLPPNIEREVAFGSTTLQRLNEQSLVLKTCNLQDGDARAVYKTCDFDFRQYGRLKMFVHAEQASQEFPLYSGDLTVFIRMGTDFTKNFYEYEIPLTLTNWGESDPNLIWPTTNAFDFDLNLLQETKQRRNVEMRKTGATVTLTTPYVELDGNNKITVVGMPNLSDVKTIMIGIRNPKQTSLTGTDDGQPKCAEIWVNELRVSDFNNKGGWAANSRITSTLADFGTFSFAGNIATAGFGSIEQKLDERSKDNLYSYDVATGLELGKFFPEKTGIRIPMHYDFAEGFSVPQYNPLDPDVPLKDAVNSLESKTARDSLRKITQDYTRRKSINFVNVKKNRTGAKKAHLYDVENLDFTYAFSEIYRRNIDIEYNTQRQIKGGIGYNFSKNPKSILPFAKIKPIAKYKSLKLIKDFNFALLPKMISFRTDMDKQYNEMMMRNTTGADLIIKPTYVKDFIWNRIYSVKWDLTQALKLEFDANTNARIDEPYGKIDKSDPFYQEKKDTVWNNIRNMGRMEIYKQTGIVNYTLPINKIPLFNWITINARYNTDYTWTAARLAAVELGNTIENSNSKQLNGQLNMTNFYNKLPYFKKVLSPAKPKNNKSVVNSVPPKGKSTKGKEETGDTEEKDTTKVPVNYAKIIFEGFVKAMLGLKTVSFGYTETNGTFMPGFMPKPYLLGQDWTINAPGTPFTFGSQADIRPTAVQHGWLSPDTMMNNAYVTKYAVNFNGRVTIEPIKDFRIELTATRNYVRNHQEYFKANAEGSYDTYTPTTTGNFSITWVMWKTAFVRDNKDHSSETFNTFKENRFDIAMLLAEANPNWDHTFDSVGFPVGYGGTSQDVLLPAFLTAYSGVKPSGKFFNYFQNIPKPNWRVTYDGLMKIKMFKKIFKTFTVGHSYRCTYNIGAYTTNLLFDEKDGFASMQNAAHNYIPKYDVNVVTISEQFAPLFNLDMTWQNSLITKLEMKKTRDLSLSFSNNQLTEVKGQEIVVGTGYRFKNVSFILNSQGRKKKINSDLNVTANVSIRTNKTVLRKIVENVSQVSSGQRMISINTAADYQISPKFNIRLFFDKIITNPFVSSQFPNSNTNGGISIRFTLAQ